MAFLYEEASLAARSSDRAGLRRYDSQFMSKVFVQPSEFGLMKLLKAISLDDLCRNRLSYLLVSVVAG